MATNEKVLGHGGLPPRNLFIQMSGAPGSGKSTMAKLLQQSIGGIVVDNDIIKSCLLEDSTEAWDQVSRRAYRLQWMWAEEAAKQGLNVIVDSTCNYQEVIDRGSTIAGKYGLEYWHIECRVEDIDLLDGRLRARQAMTSQRSSVDAPPAAAVSARKGVDSRALFKKWMNPFRPERNCIVVDTTTTPEVHRDYILRQIRSETVAEADKK